MSVQSSKLSKDGSRSSAHAQEIPALIDLNINMSSLNGMLKNIIQTINQHASLINSLSTTSHLKFEKALYKQVLTKELTKRGYSGPPDVTKAETEEEKEIRSATDHVHTQKWLKYYIECEEFPSLITYNAIKANDDLRYLYELIQNNHDSVVKSIDTLRDETTRRVIVGQKTNRPYYKLAVKMQAGNFDIAAIQEVWKQFTDKEMKWYELSDNYAALMKEENKSFSAVLTFSVLTIIISCLGLFGLVVFSVDQRYKEFGIRKVLGATVQQMARLFGWDFVKLVLIAFIVAVPVSLYALDLWLNDFADRITLGAGVFAVTALITMAIVMATIAVQSIKAGQLNPIDTLRSE